MVSLLELSEIDEHGVNFKSPYDGSQCMLTPEHSMEIQNTIGADIMMQLDDVVKTTTTGPRVEEAMHRLVANSKQFQHKIYSEHFFSRQNRSMAGSVFAGTFA